MSDSKASQSGGVKKTQTRNLPSWMSLRENETKSHGNKSDDAKGHGQGNASSSSNTNFSELLEGVVFVLSGFVNPDRSTLRSQALAMGAEYQLDWNSSCTLLVCAFQNTPKFRQVEADCGTIVSKPCNIIFVLKSQTPTKGDFEDWILECYSQKKLVNIDPYLMHAGKPWRRSSIPHKTSEEQQGSSSTKSYMQVERTQSKTTFVPSKNKASHPAKESFSPSEVSKWVIDDFNSTISWLESQEEKPEAHEINQIAGQGILTCLQDAIDCLVQKQGVQQVTEQWSFVPRVVKELAILEGSEHGSLSKEYLLRKAKVCKQIYEDELSRLDGDSSSKIKKLKIDGGEEGNKGGRKSYSRETAGYDSEETIEMTQEEIDLAYNNFVSETTL